MFDGAGTNSHHAYTKFDTNSVCHAANMSYLDERRNLQGAAAKKALKTMEALFRPYAYQHVLTKELQAVQEYGVTYCKVLKQCAADFTFKALHDTPPHMSMMCIPYHR
jgi:hypothetical protein